jgi:hypothetical protein
MGGRSRPERQTMSDRYPPFTPSSEHPIRVILGDDHDVVREGLRRLLKDQPSLQVGGEAANGREAVTCVWK